MRNYEKTLQIGDAGKRAAKDYFTRTGWSIDGDAHLGKYVDFAISKNGHRHRVFVRTDTVMCRTDNIFIERFMLRKKEDNSRIEYGWLFEGNADVLCYLDAWSGQLYILKWGSLKDYITKHCKSFTFKNRTDAETVGEGYNIPIREIVKCDAYIKAVKIDVREIQKIGFEFPVPF